MARDTETADPLFERIKAWFIAARDHSADWRKDAEDDFAFVAGDQWDGGDLDRLRQESRPALTFNRIGVVVDAVSGSEVTNRQQVRYIPRTQGDVQVNELLTGAVEFVRDEANAEDEESDAFRDLLICGMGPTDTRLDYDDDPEGMAKIDRVDPLEFYWDPSAKKRNLADARFVMRAKEIAREEAEALFPDAEPEDLHASWADTGKSRTNDSTPPHYKNEPNKGEPTLKTVTLIECQWWEYEVYWRVKDPTTGALADFSDAQMKGLRKSAERSGVAIEAMPARRKVYRRAFVGAKVLSEAPLPCPYDFSLKCMTGARDRNARTWYGLVRAMKDPQKWANKWISQLLHWINTQARTPPLVEEGAFTDKRRAEADWARTDKIVYVKPGKLDAIGTRPGGKMPEDLQGLLQFAVSSIRDVSGVNLELLGLAERDQAGVLEAQRKKAGMTILANLFDSLRYYRKTQGKILLHLIVKYMNDGRLVRITQDGAAKYVPLAIDAETMKFDVIVDEAPAAANQKEMVWSMITQMLPILQREPVPAEIWGELMTYSPLPSALTEKIKQLLMQPNPQAEEAQALEVAERTAKIKKTNAEAQLAQARAVDVLRFDNRGNRVPA
jgi:hypothetical protein